MLRIIAGLVLGWVWLGSATPAAAHPHVWVKASAEILYADDGSVTGIRHRWSFDEAYSSFATQGLGRNGAPPTRDDLAELAKINTESLAEFDYFTVAKLDGKRQAFSDPKDPVMDYEGGVLTLTFILPLKTPAKPTRAMGLEVYDSTWFVSFAFVETEPVKAAACSVTVTRPKQPDPAQTQKLSESFFENLAPSSDFGLQFANRAVIACP